MFPIRGMELPIFLVGIVFFFIYLMSRAAAREREQKRRIDMIERALESGSVDDATKRELLSALAHDTWEGWPGRPAFMMGWIGLFVGLGLMVLAAESGRYWEPAVIVTAISFAMLSLPLAAREFQSRVRAPARGNVGS